MARRPIGKVVATSASGTVNLAVIGVAALGALALGSWPILALGGIAYAALIAADVVTPTFRRTALLARPEPARIPRAETIADPAVRAAAVAILGAATEVRKVSAETPPQLQRHLASTVGALVELEGHAAMLIERAGALAGYLARVERAAVEADVQALIGHAALSSDAEAKDQYRLAAAAAAEQLRAIDDIVAARERVLANLTRIAATLRGVPAKLVRMRALDDRASDALSGDVHAELDRMNLDLKVFEETLVSLVEAVPS
jgi:hypothetical protein